MLKPTLPTTRRFLLSLLLLAAICLPLAAQDAGEVDLARRINDVISQEDASQAFWGIEVYAPARGRVLYAVNERRYFTPASVTKLFTTAAALALLGPDYRFRTVVGSRARVDRRGYLLGHLFLVGGGDPDLGGCDLPYAPDKEDNQTCDDAAIFDQLAAAVAGRGVRAITGNLILDQSFFAPEPYPPGWTVGDLLWGYAVPVRALSLADNILTVRVEPGDQVNEIGRLNWKPDTHFYQVENQVWTSPPGGETQLYVRRDPGSRVLEISGPIALDSKGRTLTVAVEEPTEMIGDLFRRALERNGISLQGTVEPKYALAPPFTGEQSQRLPVVLAEHLSLPLAEDVRLLNKSSRNLHAEMLLRLLGRQQPPASSLPEKPLKPGEPPPRRGDGSTEAGLEVLRAWLSNAGINPDQVAFVDGSGVSRRNLVTPEAVVGLLQHAGTQPWGELWRDSLPVAGVDGTLKDRMKDSPARGRVQAKTGTLGGMNALAGSVETEAGETLLFAIFVNQHTLSSGRAEQLMDQICAALVALPASEARKTKLETR